MKKYGIIFIIVAILISCSKERITEYDFCESTLCEEYFDIWKNLLMERNGFDEEYFNEHINPYETSINSWNSGESFTVSYQVCVDWMVCNLSDNFIVKIESDHYPLLDVPRSTYLIENEIDQVVSNFAFSSSINVINPIDKLHYKSKQESINELREKSNNNSLEFTSFDYKREKPYFRPNGHPFLIAYGEIDREENKCVSGELDLFTGDWKVRERPCMIY